MRATQKVQNHNFLNTPETNNLFERELSIFELFFLIMCRFFLFTILMPTSIGLSVNIKSFQKSWHRLLAKPVIGVPLVIGQYPQPSFKIKIKKIEKPRIGYNSPEKWKLL